MTKAIVNAKKWKLAQVIPETPPRVSNPQRQAPETTILCRSDAAWNKKSKQRDWDGVSQLIKMRGISLTVNL